jgi:hypothetical protein
VKNSQVSIFGFGFPQRLEVRIRVLPKREEFLIMVKRGGRVAFHLLRASHLQPREGPYDVSHHHARMIDHFLELRCGLSALMKLKVSQAAEIRRVHAIDAGFTHEFIVQGWAKHLNRLPRIALLDFDSRTHCG